MPVHANMQYTVPMYIRSRPRSRHEGDTDIDTDTEPSCSLSQKHQYSPRGPVPCCSCPTLAQLVYMPSFFVSSPLSCLVFRRFPALGVPSHMRRRSKVSARVVLVLWRVVGWPRFSGLYCAVLCFWWVGDFDYLWFGLWCGVVVGLCLR